MNGMIERAVQEAGPQLTPADRSIGRILLDSGKLTNADAERALRRAREKGVRFGEACVQLNLVSREDVESALSRQFDFPYVRPGESDLGEDLVAAYHPFSMQVEALRALRTQLLLRWFNSERKLLAIVSPSRFDGRSYLAANLAVVFAQLGERTLLIDADMRRPRQHRLFRLANRFGLSGLLAGRVNSEAIEPIGSFGSLAVIASGATPPNPLELVSRPEFRDLLVNESRNFDVILIDTPAADSASDAQAIVARAGGALAVAREGRSRIAGLGRLASSVQGTRAELVGCVLNRH